MDEQKTAPETDPAGQDLEVEDLDVGADADKVAGGKQNIIKSGDPEDGGN
ncbi:MAG: hypothetical protein WAK93_19800 [Solirubrobacteraceae bacterium]